MEFTIDLLEKIEKYLSDQLSQADKEAFEAQMKNDLSLKNEVEQQRIFLQDLNKYGHVINLKKQMDSIHDEMNIDLLHERFIYERMQKKTQRKIYIYSLAAAASVTLLIVFSTFYFSGIFKKQMNSYMELKANMDQISSKQRSLWDIVVKRNAAKKAITTGTCFSVATNGYLVTNYHVVKNIDSLNIVNYQDTLISYKACVVYTDKKLDIAILKVCDPSFKGFKNLPYSIYNKSADLGESVYTLGYSKQDLVYSEGAISSFTGFDEDTSSYQVSIPVNPGNSGGPMFDSRGNLLGIVCAKNTTQDAVTFAVKSKYVLSSLEEISKDEEMEKPILNFSAPFNYKRTEQIKQLYPFIFKVEVYKEN